MRRLAPILAASLLTSGTAAAQSVHVVDDDGPADFTSLFDAVGAAADGDVLLLRAGDYNASQVVIDGPLTVVADDGAEVQLVGDTLVVRDLAVGETVLLQGLGFDVLGGTALRVEDSLGLVQIEDVNVAGDAVGFAVPDREGIVLEDAARVVIARSSVEGSPADLTGPAGVGLRAIRSGVHLFETSVIGGAGRAGTTGVGGDTDGGPGGDGLVLEEGFLFAGGSTIRGGPGGSVGSLFGCDGAVSGDGGTGLVLTGAAPQANLTDTDLFGGEPGGVFGSGTCTAGSAGDPSEVLAGTLQDLAGAPHGFALDSPVHDSDTTTLSFTGTPGELAWILFSPQTTAAYVPAFDGTLTLAPPVSTVLVGALDGAGAASLVVPAPLPAGLQGARFFVQPLFYDAALPQFTISTPAALVVLADGI